MANTIFIWYESQSKARLSEVFFLWAIHKDENFGTWAFILYPLVSQASTLKSPITSRGIISAIAYAWGFEPFIKKLDPLFQGEQLNLAAYINMEIFKGRVCLAEPPWKSSYSCP